MENKEALEKIVNDLVTICDSHSSISDCRLVARKYGIKCPDIGCDGCKARMFDIFRDKLDEYLKPDGLSYPLDKDGVPIKLGETVYYDKKQGVVVGISLYGCFVNNGTAEVYIKFNDTDIGWKLAKRVTHSLEQRTLDDILQDAEASVYYAKDTGNTVDELIKEAYDLGLSDGAKKDE